MPAWFLLFGIGKFTIPIPWFPVWLLSAPLFAVAWPVGIIGKAFAPRNYTFKVLLQSWRLLPILTFLHGAEIRVNSENSHILIKFI